MAADEPTSDEVTADEVPANMVGLLTMVLQMNQALDAGLYMPAMVVALTLPDIMGALESEDGRATGPKYQAWLSRNANYRSEDALRIWEIRCSLLHQGRANKGEVEVAFTVPGTAQIHNLSTVSHDGVKIGWYSIEEFVRQMSTAVIAWLKQFGATKQAQRNLERFARLRPEGVSVVSGTVLA